MKMGMHVLVLDDDPDTRDLLQHALKKEGHQVFQAWGTSDALRLSRLYPDIDVVVMDMHSRCRPSMELAQEMRRSLHNSHYVLASGDWDTLEPSCRDGNMTVLRKPYGKHDLLHAIGRIITRQAILGEHGARP